MKAVRRTSRAPWADYRARGPRILRPLGGVSFRPHHDLASAEIALSEALVAALKTLPRDGVPQNPEAWLLIAARRSLVDVVRHRQAVLESEPILQFLRERSTEAAMSTAFQDERLKLLFVRAHPAIDAAMPPLDAADGVGTGCSTY